VQFIRNTNYAAENTYKAELTPSIQASKQHLNSKTPLLLLHSTPDRPPLATPPPHTCAAPDPQPPAHPLPALRVSRLTLSLSSSSLAPPAQAARPSGTTEPSPR